MASVGVFRGYPIYVSNVGNSKYYALVTTDTGRTRKVHFGDKRYEHYEDKIGIYRGQDHKDVERRRRYKQRMEYCRHVKESAGWFADQVLW